MHSFFSRPVVIIGGMVAILVALGVWGGFRTWAQPDSVDESASLADQPESPDSQSASAPAPPAGEPPPQATPTEQPGDQEPQATSVEEALQPSSTVQIIGGRTYIDGVPIETRFGEPSVGGGPPEDAVPSGEVEAPTREPSEGAPPEAEDQAQQQQTQPAQPEELPPEQLDAALEARELELQERETALEERETTLEERETDLEEYEYELDSYQDQVDRQAEEPEDLNIGEQLNQSQGLILYEPQDHSLRRYQYDVPSGTVIRQEPVFDRPAPRSAPPPMAPGQEEDDYWHFYGYY